jgi:hypothetical protein
MANGRRVVDVELIAHLEVVTNAIAWWGESPQFPTLSVTASELRPMIDLARQAIEEMLAEVGDTLGKLTIDLAGGTAPPVPRPSPGAIVSLSVPASAGGSDVWTVQQVLART